MEGAVQNDQNGIIRKAAKAGRKPKSMTPSANGTAEVKDVPIQRTITNLDTMEEVTLVKPATFTRVNSNDEALARLGNDAKRFLDIINEGLRAEERRTLAGQPGGWYEQDDEGGIGELFNGTVADPKAVNALRLNMAKHVFGYSKDMSKEQKTAALESAMNFIKSNEAIREGLKKSAALKVETA